MKKMFTVCGIVLLAAAVAVVLASRNRRKPPPGVADPLSQAGVRVKAVMHSHETIGHREVVAASRAVAIVCGEDAASADRYEVRNNALRSIARRRDLPTNDVLALLDYLSGTNDPLRVERIAALKNDVMNLLRNQNPPPRDLEETLIAMFDGGTHPTVVLDYCIQHLGAMVNELGEEGRRRAREVLVRAAGQIRQPYAGTALYSLAEDRRATSVQQSELKRLTVALCKPEVSPVARIAAIQLAGQRGYGDILPTLRGTLSSSSRDAVLDIVTIGSIGLLGDTEDIELLLRFAGDARRGTAVDAAVKRICERENDDGFLKNRRNDEHNP